MPRLCPDPSAKQDEMKGIFRGRKHKMAASERDCKLLQKRTLCLIFIFVIPAYFLIKKNIDDRALLAEELLSAQIDKCEKNNIALAKSKTLSILTQNIWCHYLAKIGPNVESRLKAFIQGVSSRKYDIVLVQELFVHKVGLLDRTHYAKLAVKEMKRAGFKYHTSFYKTTPIFYGQSNGVVIFSRFPIIEANHVAFSDVGEHFTNKGFITAKICINQRTVDVCSVHLDAFKPHLREKNLHQIADYLKRPVNNKNMHSVSGCQVIAGDFNILPVLKKKYKNSAELEKEYPKLVEFLRPLVDVFSTDTVTIPKSGQLPDHFFIDPKYKVKSKIVEKFRTSSGQPVSDHYGLGVQLEF